VLALLPTSARGQHVLTLFFPFAPPSARGMQTTALLLLAAGSGTAAAAAAGAVAVAAAAGPICQGADLGWG
jgi:hypothetical protein